MSWSVYLCRAEDGTVLYVGMTGVGLKRPKTHAAREWWSTVCSIDLFHFETEQETRSREAMFITRYRPLHNIVHRPAGDPARLSASDVAELKQGRTAPEALSYYEGLMLSPSEREQRVIDTMRAQR